MSKDFITKCRMCCIARYVISIAATWLALLLSCVCVSLNGFSVQWIFNNGEMTVESKKMLGIEPISSGRDTRKFMFTRKIRQNAISHVRFKWIIQFIGCHSNSCFFFNQNQNRFHWNSGVYGNINRLISHFEWYEIESANIALNTRSHCSPLNWLFLASVLYISAYFHI